MTKAEIVARIAKQTGAEKEVVMNVVEAFMESVKGAMIEGNEVFLQRLRQLYHQTSSRESSQKYFTEYDHCNPGSLYPGIQTFQGIRGYG